MTFFSSIVSQYNLSVESANVTKIAERDVKKTFCTKDSAFGFRNKQSRTKTNFK